MKLELPNDLTAAEIHGADTDSVEQEKRSCMEI